MRADHRHQHHGNDGYHRNHRDYRHHRHDHLGETPTPGDGGDREKVCVRFKNDDDNKKYRWVSEGKEHRGDKVVKDKFCEQKKKGGHKGNDHNAHAKKNGDSGRGNDDD